MITRRNFAALALSVTAGLLTNSPYARANDKQLVYLSAGIEAPFWRYVSKGAEATAAAHKYQFMVLDSRNNAQSQLRNAQDAIVGRRRHRFITDRFLHCASSPRPRNTWRRSIELCGYWHDIWRLYDICHLR